MAETPNKTPIPRPDGRGALLVGNPGNKGGGRRKDVWRERIGEALDRSGGVELLVRVVNGEETTDVVTVNEKGENVVTKVRPDLRYRIMAANILIEQAHGKPPQEVKLEEEKPRRTEDEVLAHILEMLPRVIAILPLEKRAVAELFQRRRQIELVMGPNKVATMPAGVTQEEEQP